MPGASRGRRSKRFSAAFYARQSHSLTYSDKRPWRHPASNRPTPAAAPGCLRGRSDLRASRAGNHPNKQARKPSKFAHERGRARRMERGQGWGGGTVRLWVTAATAIQWRRRRRRRTCFSKPESAGCGVAWISPRAIELTEVDVRLGGYNDNANEDGLGSRRLAVHIYSRCHRLFRSFP